MTKRYRELERMALAVAEQANARLLDIQRTGRGHLRLVFSKNGTAIAMYAASSPSDGFRDLKNTAAQARRVLSAPTLAAGARK
jgi:hypothetical protein